MKYFSTGTQGSLRTSGNICETAWGQWLYFPLSTTPKWMARRKEHIEQVITCMLADPSLLPEAWCEVVGALELGLDTAVSDSTGKPPAPVALGEMQRLPVDLIVGTD